MRNFFAALFLFLGNVTTGQSPKTLYFDPASTMGAPVSRLFESVTYIPLETTKQSLFGQISRLVVTDQYFIIFDYDTQALYFFDKQGKFVKKYKDEKYNVVSMRWIENDNKLYLMQINKNFRPTRQEMEELLRKPLAKNNSRYGRAVLYNLADVQKEQITEIPDFTIFLMNPLPLAPQQWVYSLMLADKGAKDSVDYELKVSDGNKTIGAYFPYAKRTATYLSDPTNIDFAIGDEANTLLFTRPFTYSIYQLTTDSVKNLYTIVLPFENTVPKTFFTKEFSTANELRDYKQTNPAVVWRINGIVPINSYLFFSLDYQKRDRRFMFERSTNRFYNVNKITADSTNAFLPVIGWDFQYYDKAALYSSISSDAMFRSRDAEKHRNPVYTPLLNTYFETSKPSSNPVIIILKPLTKNK